MRFSIRCGRRIEPRVSECADRLDRYWDEVKDVVLQPPVEQGNLSRTLMLNWIAKECGDRRQLGPARRLVAFLRESLAGCFPHQRVALRRGLSFLKSSTVTAFQQIARRMAPRVSEPMIAKQTMAERTMAEPKAAVQMPPAQSRVQVLKQGAGRMLNLQRIEQQKLEIKPYQWASIDQLFSREDAALLAASFPRDKFKTVKGYDGEKAFEYMSRSLIHMGASVSSHAEGLAPAWRALSMGRAGSG